MTDTYILIDIQAENKFEILKCIQETFAFMPGWYYEVYGPADSRFYQFSLTYKWFRYLRPDDSFSDTMDADEVVIKDLADISNLLEFINANTETLRGDSLHIKPLNFDGIVAQMKASYKEKYAKTKIDEELYGNWGSEDPWKSILEIQGLPYKKYSYADELKTNYMKKINPPMPFVDYSFTIGHTSPKLTLDKELMAEVTEIVKKSKTKFMMLKEKQHMNVSFNAPMNDDYVDMMSMSDVHWSGE